MEELLFTTGATTVSYDAIGLVIVANQHNASREGTRVYQHNASREGTRVYQHNASREGTRVYQHNAQSNVNVIQCFRE